MGDGARALVERACLSVRPLRLRVLRSDPIRARGEHLELMHARLCAGGRDGPAERIIPLHDKVRDAVRRSLEPTLRKAHHRFLATQIELAEGDAWDVAVHWRDAGEPDRARHAAAAGAERAGENLAYGLAARLYELAAAHAQPEAQVSLHERRAEMLAAAGDNGGAGLAGLEVARLLRRLTPDEPSVLYHASRAAGRLLRWGDLPRGLEELDRCLAAVGQRRPRSVWQSVLAGVLRERWLLGRERAPRPTAPLSPERSAELEVLWAGISGLAWADPMTAAHLSSAHCRVSLVSGDYVNWVRALGVRAVSHAAVGGKWRRPHLERLTRRLEEVAVDPAAEGGVRLAAEIVLATASAYRFEWSRGFAHLARAEALLDRHLTTGDYARTDLGAVRLTNAWLGSPLADLSAFRQEHLRDASELGERLLHALASIGHSNLPLLAAGRTDLVEVGTLEAIAPYQGGNWSLIDAWAHLGRAQAALYSGDLDLAARLLRVERRRSWPGLHMMLPVWAMSGLLDGGLALRRARRAPGRWARWRWRARAAARSRALMRKRGVPWCVGLGHALRAGVEHERGRGEAALAHARLAVERLQEARVPVLERAVRQHLHTLGGGEAPAWSTAVREPVRFASAVVPILE